MREDAFRAFLAPRLGRRSVDSYVAYVRRVETMLDLDLDRAALDEAGIASIADALAGAGMVGKSVGNSRSSLRRYAEMTGRHPAAGPGGR